MKLKNLVISGMMILVFTFSLVLNVNAQTNAKDKKASSTETKDGKTVKKTTTKSVSKKEKENKKGTKTDVKTDTKVETQTEKK